MNREILTYDLRSASDVPSNVVTDMDDAIGLFARNDIFQGETLTTDAIVDDPTLTSISEFGPSSLIPQGFIAIGVPIRDDVASVAYAVDQGDYIDVMISFDIYRIDEQFQTYLENHAVFFVEESIKAGEAASGDEASSGEGSTTGDTKNENTGILFFVRPFGRFEELATGDTALINPSGDQRPVHVGLILQNAKVIQVGTYTVPEPVDPQLPTPTAVVGEGEDTPTPPPQQAPTATPQPPRVLVVALSPQQQLFLKHAIEVNAEIDFALRGVNDNQLFEVENVDLDFLLNLFSIEVPPNFGFTLEQPTPSSDNGSSATPPAPTAAPTQEFGDG
jgi:Flp pilus assembly protein CpaB